MNNSITDNVHFSVELFCINHYYYQRNRVLFVPMIKVIDHKDLCFLSVRHCLSLIMINNHLVIFPFHLIIKKLEYYD